LPELPDVETFKRRVARQGLRKKIARVTVSDPRILGKLSAQALSRTLRGRKLTLVRRHGKHLLAKIDGDGWLTLHFGMTGGLQFFKIPAVEPPFTRVRLDFEAGDSLAYTNKRMIGRVGLVKDADEFIAAERLGPDALDRHFTLAGFKDEVADNRRDVKSILMDQKVVAGIGNIYSDEILFQARIHPKTRVDMLESSQLNRLYRTMRTVLKSAVARGAGSEQFVDRMPRGAMLPARKRGGRWPRCGSALKVVAIGGRTSYFCSRCQR